MVTITSTLRSAACLVALAAMSVVVPGGFATAQDLPPQDSSQNGGPGVRAGHITATGETVPNPGASQSAGTTSMDRGIERRNDEIQSSICKGC